jgi:diguanylate cyclase (GGDEF)-like protein
MTMTRALILIVDDEPANLAMLKQILGNAYTLAFARSGTECLAAVRKHQPALILLDIQMPDMDGYAVCRQLKADPATAHTPVIFVSALSEVGDEAAGFACGGVDYIVKPVSPALVHARVRTHLSLVDATRLEHYVEQLEIEQARTARLSRIHALLSGANSTIVRQREPQSLIVEACRIAVHHGGFGIAWIGLATRGAVRAMSASDGIEPDQLAAAGLALPADGAPPDNIAQAVWNTRATAVCNDARSTAGFPHTCADALQRGYLSVIGLPLTVADAVAGVLVLYAREAGRFDEEEIKLLSELAGDISFALQSIANEQRASFLSCYDDLTAMPNTPLFLDGLERLLHGARSAGGNAFVVTLNLDRFRQLNDVYGRHVGDQMLRMVARRLQERLEHSYCLARTGADNFAIAGELAPGQDISALCQQVIALLGEPLRIDEHLVALSVRLGVALFPSDADLPEQLFRNAEAALEQSRAEKTRYSFYARELNARMAELVELESMLKTALEQRQFALYYQPKVDLHSGRIAGAEALIRWQHPQRGLIPPADFIPLAEDTGLIVPIGTWVIQAVCAQLAAWRREGVTVVPVALNLSALQFRDGDVRQEVSDALTANGLEPGCAVLELTESLVMHAPEQAEQTMHALRTLGLSLSMDDFGTGYSSLAYLKRFPFDSVKIDRAFVTDITSNEGDAAIARAIIAMAHSLHMHVVAEGVETEAQLKLLRDQQCDQIQGYYFSRPVPAADFGAMLRNDKRLQLDDYDVPLPPPVVALASPLVPPLVRAPAVMPSR